MFLLWCFSGIFADEQKIGWAIINKQLNDFDGWLAATDILQENMASQDTSPKCRTINTGRAVEEMEFYTATP